MSPGPDDVRALLEGAAGRALGELDDTTALAEELGFDSLAFLELTVALEERFGIAVGSQDVAGAFRTVGCLRALLSARTARGA